MTDHPSLLARIRKCLALAKSANEHEAAAALAKARELMDAHAISMTDVELSEVAEATAKGTCTQRPPMWEKLLCATVRHALGVEVILYGDHRRIYIGVGAAPEIATYAFTVLFRQLRAARRHYIRTTLKRCGPARKRQRADIFCEAWALAVYRKVEALMPERKPSDVVGSYIQKRFTNLATVSNRAASTKGVRTSADYWNGREAGSQVDLAHGVGTAARPAALAYG